MVAGFPEYITHGTSNNVIAKMMCYHRGQNSKQIDIAKYVSNFLIYGAKMLDKCVKSQKNFFVHCPFLQSQAK